MNNRDCPSCGKELSYSTSANLRRAIQKGAVCRKCRTYPEEVRRKISASCMGNAGRPAGLPFTEEHRISLSIAAGGDGDIERLNNPTWRPGPLRRLRKECLERDNHACVYCGKHDGELHAHHILSWIKHEAHRYFLNNLITLCKPCHIEEHRINGNI